MNHVKISSAKEITILVIVFILLIIMASNVRCTNKSRNLAGAILISDSTVVLEGVEYKLTNEECLRFAVVFMKKGDMLK